MLTTSNPEYNVINKITLLNTELSSAPDSLYTFEEMIIAKGRVSAINK